MTVPNLPVIQDITLFDTSSTPCIRIRTVDGYCYIFNLLHIASLHRFKKFARCFLPESVQYESMLLREVFELLEGKAAFCCVEVSPDYRQEGALG